MRVLRETIASEGRRAGFSRTCFYAPWSRDLRRCRETPRLRSSHLLARTRHVAVLRQHILHARGQFHGVPARHAALGSAHGEPGLCGRQGQHRLGSGRARADSPQLGWPDARSRRRPLRMGWVFAGRQTAFLVQSRERICDHLERNESSGRLSISGAQAQLRMDERFAPRPHRRSFEVAAQSLDRGFDEAAERRHVHPRAATGRAAGSAQVPTDPKTKAALDLLRGWDARETSDSAASGSDGSLDLPASRKGIPRRRVAAERCASDRRTGYGRDARHAGEA